MSLANGSAPTRHQAGMSTTMPNALRDMYLLITALRGKSRLVGTKTIVSSWSGEELLAAYLVICMKLFYLADEGDDL
jgi:hypothetical protein